LFNLKDLFKKNRKTGLAENQVGKGEDI